jgi:hypothetical protein
LRIASAGASVYQVLEDLNALQDDIVRLATGNTRHKTDAATVVFMLRVVEALRLGSSRKWVDSSHVVLQFECPVAEWL